MQSLQHQKLEIYRNNTKEYLPSHIEKWSFIARDEKLTLYDGGLFYNEFNREIVRIKYR
jgi:hypothetical protein